MGECVCVSVDYEMGNVSGFPVKPIPEIHSAVGDLNTLLKIHELSQEMSQNACPSHLAVFEAFSHAILPGHLEGMNLGHCFSK